MTPEREAEIRAALAASHDHDPGWTTARAERVTAALYAVRTGAVDLLAEIDRLRAAQAAIVAAWDDDDIGALIDALRGAR